MKDVLKSAFDKVKKMFSNGYEHCLFIYLIVNVIWLYLGLILYHFFTKFQD